MTRDGTVGRSDATEPNLASHWDIDPVRMMRTRFADPIRASSPPGLHQQAGHMTASDLCAARQMISCQAGAIHTCEVDHTLSAEWECGVMHIRLILRVSPLPTLMDQDIRQPG